MHFLKQCVTVNPWRPVYLEQGLESDYIWPCWFGVGLVILLCFNFCKKNQKTLPEVWQGGDGTAVAWTGEIQQNLGKIPSQCCRAEFHKEKEIQLRSHGPFFWSGKIIPNGISAATCCWAENQFQGEALDSKQCSPTVFWTTGSNLLFMRKATLWQWKCS